MTAAANSRIDMTRALMQLGLALALLLRLMVRPMTTTASIPSPARIDTSLYRTVWRWHFYAGLIVLPALVWLAVTGALYLYKAEIERLVYRDLVVLDGPVTRRPQPPSRLAAVAERGGGRVTQITRPADPRESWRLTVEWPDGRKRTAYVDPYRAVLLGTTAPEGMMKTVRDLHSLALTGPIGNAVIEIVAGWAIVLCLTGFYLWWPRRGMPALALRGSQRGRLFWRDLHASAGALVGLVVLFLATTGMPWSGLWGKVVQDRVTQSGFGRPKSPEPDPRHQAHGQATLPWSMQAAARPMAHGRDDIGPDRAAAIAEARGLHAPWMMTLPSGPGVPYLLSATVTRAQDARVTYIEPASGRVLQDAAYGRFGAGAKAIEWGIATHQGQQYGEPNRLVMLAGCIGVLLLSMTAPIMWWKRRGAPPRAADRARARGVASLMLILGALFPLTGATMVVALVLEAMAKAISPYILNRR